MQHLFRELVMEFWQTFGIEMQQKSSRRLSKMMSLRIQALTCPHLYIERVDEVDTVLATLLPFRSAVMTECTHNIFDTAIGKLASATSDIESSSRILSELAFG